MDAVFRALPLIVVFSLAWAAGECVGYLWNAGASAHRID